VAHRDTAVAHVEDTEHDRKVEPARADGARIEDGQVAITTDEGNVRMAAHDDRASLRARHARRLRTQLRPVDRDVQQQDLEQALAVFADVQGEGIGEVGSVDVDVAAHRRDGGNRAERIEHIEIPDVARMKDAVRTKLREELGGAWMRRTMGIGDDRQTQRTVMELDALVRAQEAGFTGRRGLRHRAGSVAHGREGNRPPRVAWLVMNSRVLLAATVALVALVFGSTGCSGGSTLGTGDGGSGSGEGTSGASSSTGTSGAPTNDGTNGTSGTGSNGGTASDQPAPAPSSPPPSDDPAPGTGTGGSTGPRPECVAFANHQCACYGTHASATCTTDLASGCTDGVKLCASQLDWYNCVTANACGTNACAALGKGC
jgi:hypothetical protein